MILSVSERNRNNIHHLRTTVLLTEDACITIEVHHSFSEVSPVWKLETSHTKLSLRTLQPLPDEKTRGIGTRQTVSGK